MPSDSTYVPPKAVVEWHGDEVEGIVAAMVATRLDAAAIMVDEEAQDSMQRPKSGRTTGAFTTRSAPGEPPAAQAGSRGLQGTVAWRATRQLEREIGTSEDYGLYLEVGTRNMAARPWLEVALLAMADKIKRLFTK